MKSQPFLSLPLQIFSIPGYMRTQLKCKLHICRMSANMLTSNIAVCVMVQINQPSLCVFNNYLIIMSYIVALQHLHD